MNAPWRSRLLQVTLAWLTALGVLTAWAAPASHALLIGISRYDPASGATDLLGVPQDMQSATQIARQMGIAAENIRILRDASATKPAIVRELGELSKRVGDGGRALIYFSGHGTRWFDPSAQGCVEGLYTYEGGVIVNREFAALTKALSDKADKLIVMFDACHSGGVSDSGRTRSLVGGLMPKFIARANASPQSCSIPSNLKTRSLLGESTGLGIRAENIIHISSSRPDEVSFDEPGKGGLATQAIRDCMFGKAKDLDGSGGITLAEIEHCARQQVRARLAQHPDLLPHHPMITGQRNLLASVAPTQVPQAHPPPAGHQSQLPSPGSAQASETLRREQQALAEAMRMERERQLALEAARQRERDALARREQERLAQAQRDADRLAAERAREAAQAREQAERDRLVREQRALEEEAQRLVQLAEQTRQRLATEEQLAQQALRTPALEVDPPPALGPIATLGDVLNQRDPRRSVDLRLRQARLKIDRDELALALISARSGYLYLIHIEPNLRSFTLLFPNALQPDNRIAANQAVHLPRMDWRLVSAGPPGKSHLLAVVTDQPRDVAVLPPVTTSLPFSQLMTDDSGRGRLLQFVIGSGDPFGASMVEVEEVP